MFSTQLPEERQLLSFCSMGVIIFQQFFSFLKSVFVIMCVCFFYGGRPGGLGFQVSLIGWWNWVWNGDAFDFEN